MAHSELSTIRQLLRSRNLSSIREAVELVESLDDHDLWDDVLGGAEWVKDDMRKRLSTRRTSKGTRMIGRIRPSHIFKSTGPSMLWDEMATMMLLARSKSPIRETVTHLTVTAEDFYEIDLNLDDLPKFPNLKHLDLALGVSRSAIEDTEALWGLETLRLRESVMRTDRSQPRIDIPNLLKLDVISFDPASELPSLVHLDAANVTVPSLSTRMPKLELLRCNGLSQPSIDVHPIEFEGVKSPHGNELVVTTDDLEKIGNLHGLRLLRVRSANPALDVTPLLESTSLRAVDLRAATLANLAVLETHPELRYIAVDGSKINKASLPPALRRLVSVAKNVDLVKGSEKPLPTDRPKSKKPRQRSTNLDAGQKRIFSKVKKLLTTPDVGQMLQGAEVLAGIGDEQIIDELLDGVSVDESGELQPNTPFTAGKYRQHWLTFSLLNLLAQLDHPLVAAVTKIDLDTAIAKPALIDPPLHFLQRFTNVRSARLTYHTDAQPELAFLTEMPQLTRLHIGATNSPELPSLSGLMSLTATTLTMPAANRWPALAKVRVDSSFVGELTSTTAPALQSLDYMGNAILHSFEHLARVFVREPKKRPWGQVIVPSALEFDRCGTVDELTLADCTLRLDRLTEIGALTLSSCLRKDYRCLGNVERIGSANLHEAGYLTDIALPPNTASAGGHVDLSSQRARDLTCLRSLTGVTTLTLRQIVEPLSLEPLRDMHTLRALDLRGSTGITDLSPIEDLPELQIVALQRTGVEHIPLSLEPLADLSAFPSLSQAGRDAPEPEAGLTEAETLNAQLHNAVRRANTEAVLRLIDAVAESESPELIEEFLGTFGRSNGEITTRGPYGPISKGDRGRILGRLLSLSGEDSKAAKKWRKCTELRLKRGNGGSGVIVVDFLDEFPSLEQLEIRYAIDIDFARFRNSKLEELTLVCGHDAITGAANLAKLPLRTLRTTPCFDLRLLNDHPTLEALVIRGSRSDVTIPAGLTIEPSFGHF